MTEQNETMVGETAITEKNPDVGLTNRQRMALAEFYDNLTCWTQGTHARNADGERVEAVSASAVTFCPLGAVKRVCGASSLATRQAFDQIRIAAGLDPNRSIAFWNDQPGRTAEQVRDVMHAAFGASESSNVAESQSKSLMDYVGAVPDFTGGMDEDEYIDKFIRG